MRWHSLSSGKNCGKSPGLAGLPGLKKAEFGIPVVSALSSNVASPPMKSPVPALARSSLFFAILTTAHAQSGDPGHGKVLFQQSCALCHSTVVGPGGQLASGQGPSLVGVVGRRAAALSNFNYSKALGASGITWDATSLDRFLSAPSADVPGTTMPIVTPKASDRLDIIAYLSTVVGGPAPSGSNAAAAPETLSFGDPGDWHHAAPGMRHSVVLADLPAPLRTVSSGNGPNGGVEAVRCGSFGAAGLLGPGIRHGPQGPAAPACGS